MLRHSFIALVIAALLLLGACGCVPSEAAADPTWWIHGIAVTESGAPVGGGTVELWRISGNEWALLASRVSASQAWGFETRQMAARYRVVYVAPAGWRCVSVRSAGVGWQYPGGCVGQIALPEQAPSLGPDLVFVVRYAATPPPIPTSTPTRVPSATPTSTRLWPTDEPTRTPTPQGTAVPTPTRACENAMLVIPYEDRLTIREQAARELFRLEEDLDWFDDPTLIRGLALFNSAPLSRRFTVTGAGGVRYDCRAFANQIIAIVEGGSPCETGVVFWDSPWQWPGHVYEGR